MARQYSDGSIQQTAVAQLQTRHPHETMRGPVLGVVLSVRAPDEPGNSSAARAVDGRGAYSEAVVLVVDTGRGPTTGVLQHVALLPDSLTSADDYAEDSIRGCTGLLDGGATGDLTEMPVEKLDGEWCLVDFLGDNLDRPFISKWWPHPGNRTDPATSGRRGTLDQRGRFFRRLRGTKLIVTPEGSVYLDTNEANSYLQPTQSGPERKRRDPGGDVQLDVKAGRRFEVNLNPPVALPTSEPSLSQPNPPASVPEQAREDTLTRWSLDRDFVEAVAGQVARLFARADTDGVILGGTPEEHATSPALWERAPLGLRLFSRFNDLVAKVNALATAYRTHDGHLPSGTGIVSPNGSTVVDADPMEDSDLSDHVRVR